MSKLPVTVIMLTLNEEYNLPGAIESAKDWAEDIFVLDSLSTDKTVDIALEHDVHIVQRPFTNFGDQWNFALERLPIKTPWTFKVDPDERVTPQLVDEMRELLEGKPSCCGYVIDRRLWFMGKPLHVLSANFQIQMASKPRRSTGLIQPWHASMFLSTIITI